MILRRGMLRNNNFPVAGMARKGEGRRVKFDEGGIIEIVVGDVYSNIIKLSI